MSMTGGNLVRVRQWFLRFGANSAGVLWNSGTALQFLLGAVTLSPRILVSSAFNVASSSSAMVLGHRDWGVVLVGALGTIGTGIFLFPGLADGSVSTWVGYMIFCAAETVGVFGASLTRRYRTTDNALLRATFGHPRRMMGSVLFLARVPIIANAVLHQDWITAAPFVVWALGDLTFSLSGEEAAREMGAA